MKRPINKNVTSFWVHEPFALAKLQALEIDAVKAGFSNVTFAVEDSRVHIYGWREETDEEETTRETREANEREAQERRDAAEWARLRRKYTESVPKGTP